MRPRSSIIRFKQRAHKSWFFFGFVARAMVEQSELIITGIHGPGTQPSPNCVACSSLGHMLGQIKKRVFLLNGGSISNGGCCIGDCSWCQCRVLHFLPWLLPGRVAGWCHEWGTVVGCCSGVHGLPESGMRGQLWPIEEKKGEEDRGDSPSGWAWAQPPTSPYFVN